MKLEIILVTPTTFKFLQNRYPYRDCLTSKTDALNDCIYRIPNLLSAPPTHTPGGKDSLFTILKSWAKDQLLAIEFAFPLTTMSEVIFWVLPIIGIIHWCEKQSVQLWLYNCKRRYCAIYQQIYQNFMQKPVGFFSIFDDWPVDFFVKSSRLSPTAYAYFDRLWIWKFQHPSVQSSIIFIMLINSKYLSLPSRILLVLPSPRSYVDLLKPEIFGRVTITQHPIIQSSTI